MTWPPTVPGRDLNPGPLSFEASALLTELTRPGEQTGLSHILKEACCPGFASQPCAMGAGHAANAANAML